MSREIRQSGAPTLLSEAEARAAKAAGKEVRFTALLHHITPQLLRESFMQLKRHAAAGVDGVRWCEYEEGLDERIGKLWDAVHSGRYRALPSRRVYMPKADGKLTLPLKSGVLGRCS